jgi:hypothetical protein
MTRRKSSSTTTMKRSNDPMLDGYQFPSGFRKETPYDFLTNEDGFRPSSPSAKPSGCSVVDLQKGIETWHNIPPVAVWGKGKWFESLKPENKASIGVSKKDEHFCWIVPGEGTPGNFLLRAYLLPASIANIEDPDHPSIWTDEERKRGNLAFKSEVSVSGYGGGWSYGGGGGKKESELTLPVGITYRCVGCGHWFESETKLAGHATHCCPGSDNWGEFGADWIIACKCCLTFDETAMCKPGYPRYTKKEEVEVEHGAESAEEGEIAAAPASA